MSRRRSRGGAASFGGEPRFKCPPDNSISLPGPATSRITLPPRRRSVGPVTLRQSLTMTPSSPRSRLPHSAIAAVL
jgi:hypothetical protein